MPLNVCTLCAEPLNPLTLEISTLTMQHAACAFNPVNIPWILQEGAFPHSSFWQEDFCNISNHLPVSCQ